MSSTAVELRNSVNNEQESTPLSTEELLIEKLDIFLSLIENRIDRFERYFRILSDRDENAASLKEDASEETKSGTRSRADSGASLASIRDMSSAHLSKVYEQLTNVKQLVLKNSFKNVGHLYKTLDYHYNQMFYGKQQAGKPEGDWEEEPSTIEALQGNVITTIHYFENKLSQIDKLFSSVSNGELEEPDNALRYFNFNKALKHAEKDYLHYYQLPLLWRENRYIIHGYRFTMNHWEMTKTMFHFNHNETGNIWSHMLGLFVISYFAFWHYTHTETFARNTLMDNAIMYVFFASSAKCLVSSVLWHTYLCFAALNVRARFACVDYTGITVLITCSVISAEYCALYNLPKPLAFFVGFSALCGAGGLVFNWLPYFDRPECRHFRIAFFVGLALLGGTTFFIKWYYEGFSTTLHFYLPLTYKSFIWYWIGVVFYGGLIPERWRYDILFPEDNLCSHSYTTLDVLSGHIEHAGEEEIKQIETQFDKLDHGLKKRRLGKHETADEPSTGGSCQKRGANVDACDCGEIATKDPSATNPPSVDGASDARYTSIVEKYFPAKPVKTPYHRDFMSLWWVDYIASSHNIWHVFVVFGIVGHYFSLLDMFEQIAGNQ